MLYAIEDMAFNDELLGTEVRIGDVRKAESWLYVLAKRLGVPQSDVVRSFIVDELFTLYCYREVCMNKAASMAGQYSRNGEDSDYYSKKMRFINDRIGELERRITAEDLTGQPKKYDGFRTVPLYRGG